MKIFSLWRSATACYAINMPYVYPCSNILYLEFNTKVYIVSLKIYMVILLLFCCFCDSSIDLLFRVHINKQKKDLLPSGT